jgi:chromate transport protein ChrA
MTRDMNDKLMEAIIIGYVLGGILGLTAFVLTFVDANVAMVLAIFACIFILSGTILVGTNLIIKTITDLSGTGKKTNSD